MEKELYVIKSKIEDSEIWELVAGFRTSKDANDYFREINTSQNPQVTIFPISLPENYQTFFNQFKYCTECETITEDKKCYLIEVKHAKDKKWHFDCIISNQDDANDYVVNSCDKKRLVYLKLPYPRNFFLSEMRKIQIEKIKQKDKKRRERCEINNRIVKMDNKLTSFERFAKITMMGTLILSLILYFK